MYNVTDGKIVIKADTLDIANRLQKQLNSVYGHAFRIERYTDSWGINFDK